jgi:hypothetical protein
MRKIVKRALDALESLNGEGVRDQSLFQFDTYGVSYNQLVNNLKDMNEHCEKNLGKQYRVIIRKLYEDNHKTTAKVEAFLQKRKFLIWFYCSKPGTYPWQFNKPFYSNLWFMCTYGCSSSGSMKNEITNQRQKAESEIERKKVIAEKRNTLRQVNFRKIV